MLTAEVGHQEWLRISRWVKASNLTDYDPRNDSDAVEYPPVIRFRER
ncbi:hypothetical protein OTB20_41245 [Streptomyces sp. H27-H1]|nr:hypothetical protein [Streptomyces sp. H27-H1]MCY0932458.1 hypothetical protein [Streptomyces sp. H27-H1]